MGLGYSSFSKLTVRSTDGSDAGIDVVSSEYAVIAAEQTALQNLSQDLAQRMVTRVALALREGSRRVRARPRGAQLA